MKFSRSVALLVLLLAATPAVAQWQTPNHSVPIGRGAGVTGFGKASPGTVGVPLVSTGLTLDPVFAPAQNAGIQPGASDTYKGSLNGTTTSDIAMPSCTGLGQAIRYALGIGPNCATVTATTGFDMPVNLGLSASVAASSLTLNVTQASGAAPTSSNPVVAYFRSTTATLGTVVTANITAPLSISIPAGATLGTSSSSVPFRIVIFLNYNAGTPAIGVATCSNTSTIFPCTGWESSLKTSIAPIANSAGVLYATAGVSNDAVRIVGYCDYANGLATAGAWLSSCTTLQVAGPGVRRPGDVVQSISVSTTTPGTTTSATFAALISGLTQAITLSSSMNLVRVTATGSAGNTGSAGDFLQLARGAVLIGQPQSTQPGAAGYVIPLTLNATDAPGTVSSTTYGFQGKTPSGTLSYPNTGTGLVLELQEIQG